MNFGMREIELFVEQTKKKMVILLLLKRVLSQNWKFIYRPKITKNLMDINLRKKKQAKRTIT